MATIVKFRPRRDEADAVRPRLTATTPHAPATEHPVAADAEIILMPLQSQKPPGGNRRPRKPLKRRFTVRELAPA
jgi:hypothetical protein